MTSFIKTVETDLTQVWGTITGDVETDALALWGDFKGILTSMVPSEWNQLVALVAKVVAGASVGTTLEDLETALLNDAEVQLLPFVANLGSAVLQAVIAVYKTTLAQAAAVVTTVENDLNSL